MPEQTPKGLCLTTSSPEAATLLPTLKPSWALLPAVVPRSALSGRRLQLGLQIQATWLQGDSSLLCTSEKWAIVFCVHWGFGSLTGKTRLPFSEGSPCGHPGCPSLDLKPWDSRPSQGGWRNKVDIPFLSLTFCQCCVEVQLTCRFVFVLSIRCTDSCMMYTHTACLCLFCSVAIEVFEQDGLKLCGEYQVPVE